MELSIGGPYEKCNVLIGLAKAAHLAHDRNLVRKASAMDKFEQLVDDTKLKNMLWCYEILEKRFSQWSTEFSSGILIRKRLTSSQV